MFNNISKMIFLLMLILSTLISISANSWFGVWMGLEMNLMSFIPLMSKTNNLMSSEASIKYFIVQAFASTILLFFSIMFMMTSKFFQETNLYNMFSLFIYLSLTLKMGAAPFHFWMPNVMEGLSWMNNLILLSWQKIAPMLIISYSSFYNFFFIIIIFSIIMGALGGLNQTSLRKILAFSSISHIGWMMSAIMMNTLLWIIYFIIYFFINLSLILMFYMMKMFYLNQIYSLFMNSYLLKFIFSMNLLSLGGLPPFIGFFPKWMVIQFLSNMNQFILIMMMMMMTLITLYFYLRISMSSFILNYSNMKWNFFYFNNYWFNYIMSMFTLISLMMLFMIIFFLI